MIKNKKNIFVLIVLLICLYFVIAVVLSIPRGNKYKKTVFLGSNTKVYITDNNIEVSNDNAELRKQKVKFYYKGKFVNGSISSRVGETEGIVYELYNSDNIFVIPERLIAHTDDLIIDVKKVQKYESYALDELYAFYNNSSISGNVELDYLYISSFDYNDDGQDEYIYSFGLIVNGFNNEEDTKYKSIVFMKNKDKYILVDNEESEYNFDYKRLYFTNLIDFNNDGNYEYVVEKMMSEYGPDYYELYNFDGNKFVKIGGE